MRGEDEQACLDRNEGSGTDKCHKRGVTERTYKSFPKRNMNLIGPKMARGWNLGRKKRRQR